MKTFKEVWSKDEFQKFATNFKNELRSTRNTARNYFSVVTKPAGKKFLSVLRKKETIAMTVAFSASIVFASFIVGANYNARKVTFAENRVSATQILGNEKQVATNTIFKKDKELVAPATKKVDIFTPSKAAYTMENRELLAQMMWAEEGVFFSWAANDPDTIERVHKLAGSVILHRLNSGFGGAQSLADVLYAPGQYDYRTIQRVEEGRELPALVYTWADELLTQGALGPDTLVFQAEFPQGKEVYDHIGNQYFCCR